MDKRTNTQEKPAAAVKKTSVKPKTQAPADTRRFAFEHGLLQRVKSVTREGRTLHHVSGARFGNAMQRYAEECPSEREAEEALDRIAEEYVDKGYRELSGEAYAEYASNLRFSFTDEDLRGLFDAEGAPLDEDKETERAAKVLKLIYGNTELARCKRLELCFPGAALNALFANWAGAPLKNLETLALRVPNEDEGGVALPCGAFNEFFPKLKSLRLRGDADWSLTGGSETLGELYVEGNTFTLPSGTLPCLTVLDLKLTQAASLKSGESFGLYEDWGVWCWELSAACPALQRLSVDVSLTETACGLLEELLRPAVFPSLTELRPGCFINYDGDELCGVLARNIRRISELKHLTLQVRDSGDVAPLIRRLQAFPLPVCVENFCE